MIIGWIGLVLLVFSYLLLITKWSKYFLIVDALASFILTIYAILIKDIPFILVNGLITIALAYKQFKGGIQDGKAN